MTDKMTYELMPILHDGLIHATKPVPESKPDPARRGIDPSWEMEYADICLLCPLPICELETNERCSRFTRLRKQQKERKEENDESTDY